MASNTEWDRAGADDPYFAVLADPAFHKGAMDAAARERFFREGEADVASSVAFIRATVAPDFAPARTLDFGSGVGRLTIPLARVSGRVLAIDSSQGMLDEAKRNCDAAGIANVRFVRASDVSDVREPFDFVHSYIVLQHIAPRLGYAIIDNLARLVAPGGCAMIHVTFARRASWLRRFVHALRRSSRVARVIVNVLTGRPPGATFLAMYEYDRDRVLSVLEQCGAGPVFDRPTDHGGHIGAMLVFRRGNAPAP